MYVSDNQNFDEYGKMATLMVGGFSLAYLFMAFFYRISGNLYQSSMSTTAELISKSDDEIPIDNFFNPCSIPDQVASFYKNFMANFSDITCIIICVYAAILVQFFIFFCL